MGDDRGMSQQLLLPGIDPPPRPLPRPRSKARRAEPMPHSLFFALLPGAQDAASIAALAERMNFQHALKGTVVQAHRLHVTLFDLGDYAVVPRDKVEQALAAAATLPPPAFDVVFDEAVSYAKNNALVLYGDEAGAGALMAFRQRLGEALADAGFKPKRTFTPHMTLVYARRKLEKHAIEEPVRWGAGSLALIDSHVGEGVHEVLGQWPVPASEAMAA